MAANKKSTGLEPNKTATIFGGGISGLSAAHELVERGFRVYVWEPLSNDRDPTAGCDVGGMARTQWGATPWRAQPNEGTLASRLEPLKAKSAWAERSTRGISDLPWVLYLDSQAKYAVTAAFGKEALATTKDEIDAVVDQLLDDLFRLPPDQDVYCEVQRRFAASPQSAVQRAEAILKELNLRFDGRLKLSGPEELPDYAELSVVTVTRNGAERQFYLAQLDGFPDDVPFARDNGHAAANPFPSARDEIASAKEEVPAPAEDAREQAPAVGAASWVKGDRPPNKAAAAGAMQRAFDVRITFRVAERWLPGEHGFRFFPRFYYHLFDTMRRTPILEQVPKSELAVAQERAMTVNANQAKYVETGRTVFDNLRPTEMQALAFSDGGRPAVLPRRAARSLKDVRHWLSVIFGTSEIGKDGKRAEGGYGLTHRDTALFSVKMLQYLTSCDARRAEYGQMSWIEYLGGEKAYSKNFVDLVNDSPKALVAMDAKMSDARTQGSVFTQLLLDNTEEDGFRDGTLNGPTSVAWFAHWRRYLEAQGVEFIHGELEGFTRATSPNGEEVIWPKVKCFEPRYPGAMTGKPLLAPGYFVLALPPLVAKKMAKSYCDAVASRSVAAKANTDLVRLNDWQIAPEDEVDWKHAAIKAPDPKGALQHMAGIQYYFDQDAYGVDGHYYLPLSRWGLSAISQARFWQEKADWEHGYRGVVSVCLAKFNSTFSADAKPDDKEEKGQSAWASTKPELARLAWLQVAGAMSADHPWVVPGPTYWHVDTTLIFGSDAGNPGIVRNQSPLLINVPGHWEQRPGAAVAPHHLGWIVDPRPGYDVTDGIVLAGNYMQTFTRLTTMEGANESARHAVNAILRDFGKPRVAAQGSTGEPDDYVALQPCEIWPLEEREIPDFDFLKELDQLLYARGLDHFLEILDIPELSSSLLRGSNPSRNDPEDPLAILGQLDALVKTYSAPLVDFIREQTKPKDASGDVAAERKATDGKQAP